MRTYNSQATGDADQPGALGYGWQEPYATHLITAGVPGGEPGVAIVVSASGNRLRFQDLGNGRFRAFPGVYGTLVEAGGVYTETLRTQEQVIFNSAGQATALLDGHGGQLTLQYNGTQLTRIVDAADPGRFLALDYDPTGTSIVAVHDPTGRTVRYRYDGNGDLVGTTDVMNRTVTYRYQNHLLAEIDNALGQPLERTTYDVDDPTGKVIGQTLADGERFAVAYASASTTITTTGVDGTQDVEQVLYDPLRNTMSGLVKNGVLVQQVQFDLDFSPELIVDGDGNQMSLVFNAAGLPLAVSNALGATSSVDYDAQNRPITATDPLGRQSVFRYDANGDLVRETTGITTGSPGLTTLFTYTVPAGGEALLTDQRTPAGVVTHYDYNAAGQVLTATVGYGSWQAQATTYGYDDAGRLVTTTVGASTSLARSDVTRYNADNTIAQVIQNDTGTGIFDPAHPDQNVTTSYGYDALGRPRWERDGLGHYDVIQYDAADRVAWTLRNLAPVQRDSQGQPLIPATPPAYTPDQPDANVATLYGYDGLGRTVLVTQTGILTGTFNTATQTFSEATTRVTRTEYDALDHPITTTLNYRPDLPALPDANVQMVTQYDTQGNVAWQCDALNRWTQTQYDALNRPVTTTVKYENGNPLTVDPANQAWTDGTDTDLIQVTHYKADSSVAQTIANYVDGVFTASEPITDRVMQYAYDGQGRVMTTTVNADPATVGTRSDTNRVSVSAYDPLTGQLLGQRDPLGRWTSYQYDALGRVTATLQNCRDARGAAAPTGCAPFDASLPDRNVPTQTRYDALGRPVETVDVLGHVTRTAYDGLDQPTAVTQNDMAGGPSTADTNVTEQTAYDALGRTRVQTDAVGAATQYGYDALGDTIAITDPVERVSQSGYDGTGTLRWNATPDGRVTVYQVDGLGRVVATIQKYQTGAATASTPDDQDLATRTVYDAAGRVVQTVDAAGRVTAYGDDLLDHQTFVQQNVQSGTCSAPPCNVLTQYAYDRAGHRVSSTNPRGNTQRFSFNAADDRTAATDALTRTTRWEYDAGDQVMVQHDPRGSADDVSYTYDGLGRLTLLSAPHLSAPLQATYDALGERTSLSDGTGTTTFSYDALGRTTVVTAPTTGAVSYGYDAAGQRTRLRYPDGTTLGYSYDPDGQLHAVTQGSTTLAGYTYDAAGRLQQVTRANGAVSTYSYDGADRLRDVSTTANGAVRSAFQYSVDRLGQRTAVTETVPLTSTTAPTTSPVSSCNVYPIALSARTLAGVAVSTTVSSLANGTQPGNFGWLSWTGDSSDGALVASLTPPGDSASYVNPADPSDHVLAAGKSVDGWPGASNSSALRGALDQLKTQDIIVPVWDTASGSGSTATYHISAFARVRLLETTSCRGGTCSRRASWAMSPVAAAEHRPRPRP